MEVPVAMHKVVAHDEWVKARKKHLAKEKEFTRLRDQLSRERRELPWELVEKDYVFEGERGKHALSDLFDSRGQLVIYHAMFNPETAGPSTTWTADAPCFSCSFWMDNFNGITVHLNHRDIKLAAVSRAPVAALTAYKQRMGWSFPWYSSAASDFNLDYGVSFTEAELQAGKVHYNYRIDPSHGLSELPGISVFLKDDDGRIFHTYSAYARGLDMLNVAYHYMDLVPKGRDEGGNGQAWVRRRDEYAS
ncbi:MAG TPA: thioredoxin family protein [Thermomicrobiaceae bacterium]|nr:thioredoxin family protein [Thermomicrobiaceae bacterium]